MLRKGDNSVALDILHAEEKERIEAAQKEGVFL